MFFAILPRALSAWTRSVAQREASAPLYPPPSKYALPASELEAGVRPSSEATDGVATCRLFFKLVDDWREGRRMEDT